jgi:hypothetical protein
MLRRGNELQLNRSSTDSLSGVKIEGSATGLFLALFRRLDTNEAGCRVEGDSNSWTLIPRSDALQRSWDRVELPRQRVVTVPALRGHP